MKEKVGLNSLMCNAIIKYIRKNVRLKNIFEGQNYSRTYQLSDILPYILRVIRLGLPWRSLIEEDVNCSWNLAYKMFRKLEFYGIIKGTYVQNLNRYIKKNPKGKLECLLTDTTVVRNKCGVEKVKYNGHKKYKGTKVSFITDKNGIPISTLTANGNEVDSKIFVEQYTQEYLIDQKLIDEYTWYLLADSGYDTNQIRNMLAKDGIIPIIWHNNRNRKEENKLTFNCIELKIYKKRVRIKHTNNKTKTVRRINVRYDKLDKTFTASLYASLLKLILQ